MRPYDYAMEIQRFDPETGEETGLNLENDEHPCFEHNKLTEAVARKLATVCKSELANAPLKKNDRESYLYLCDMFLRGINSMSNDANNINHCRE